MEEWLKKNWLPAMIIVCVTLLAPQIGVAILLVLGIKWLSKGNKPPS